MAGTATIESRRYWNPTGFHVEQGKRYRYRATGTWSDAAIVCDANGWSRWWANYLDWAKRCRHAHWFQLVGCVDRTSEPIVMGTEGTFIAPATGELYCYANDGYWAYGNNRGSVVLTLQVASS